MVRWQRAQPGEKFAQMQTRILHNVTLLFALAATPAVLISLSRATSIGWRPFMAVHLGLLLFAWGLVAVSGRIAYWQQVSILLLINLVGAMAGYVEIGPAADGKVLLISAVMLSALFLSARWVFAVWMAAVLGLVALALAVVSGWHSFELDYFRYTQHPLAWVNSIWTIALLAGAVGYMAREMVIGLAENDRRLTAMFDSMNETVLVQQANGAVIQANQAAHQLLGAEGRLPLHQPDALTAICDDQGQSLAVADLPGRRQALAGRPVPGATLHFYRRGKSLHLLFQTVPLEPADQAARAATVTTLLDVTEQVEAQAATERALHATEAASRAKSAFLANVSHEIRTPMNAIVGMSHLLMGSALDARQLGQVRKMRSAAEGLLGVLNDVLDFSKIEAGQLRLESLPFSIESVLENALVMVAQAAEEKSLHLLVDMQPAFPADLMGDPLRLTQVLVNLLSNAVKFTEAGTVKLSIECEPVDEARLSLLMRCEDTGVGIDQERLESVFQAFTQADDSTTRRFGGTGLGLTISARLIEVMGGELQVSSELGKGSCFWFRLVLAKAADSVAPTFPEHRCLLLAQRESESTLAAYLQQLGVTYQCVSPESVDLLPLFESNRGARCSWLVEEELVDRHGESALAQLTQSLADEPNWRLLVLCGGASSTRASAVGSQLRVLERPVLPSALVRGLQSLSAGPLAVVGRVGLPDLQGRQILVVDDNSINREVVGEVLHQAGADVLYAHDGLQAVRLIRACNQKTLPKLVLMDLQMPVMDGLQAARCIREQYSADQLPIVALTAHAMEEERERVLAVGMQERLTKPVDPELLLQHIAGWMGLEPTPARISDAGSAHTELSEAKSSRVSNPSAHGSPAGASLRGLPGFNYAFGLKQVLGKRDLFLQMLGRFVARYGDIAQQLRGAQSRWGDEEQRRLVHSLKGMAATLGIEAVAEVARSLEGLLQAPAPDVESVHEQINRLEVAMQALSAAVRSEIASGS